MIVAFQALQTNGAQTDASGVGGWHPGKRTTTAAGMCAIPANLPALAWFEAVIDRGKAILRPFGARVRSLLNRQAGEVRQSEVAVALCAPLPDELLRRSAWFFTVGHFHVGGAVDLTTVIRCQRRAWDSPGRRV
jgi:hypothetical protein